MTFSPHPDTDTVMPDVRRSVEKVQMYQYAAELESHAPRESAAHVEFQARPDESVSVRP